MGKKSDRAEKAANKKKGMDEEVSDEDVPKSSTARDEVVSNDTEATKSSSGGTEFDMGEAIEMLTEKKINLREPGLLAIIKHLQSHRDTEHDSLDDYHETLTTLLVRMIRRPASVKEGLLLCRLVSLIALYHGAEENEFLTEFEKPLQSIIDGKLGTGYDDLQDYALFTLIFITFICGNEDSNRNYLMYLQDIILAENLENVSGEHAGLAYPIHVKARAIDCWVLLASQISASEILEKSKDEGVFEGMLEILRDGEGSAEVARNVSAGRGLAFLWETADSTHGEERSEGNPTIEECSHLLCDDPRVVDEAIDLIKRIAKESSKKVSKKNRKEQRAEFRDIEEWIMEATHPHEKLRMQGADYEVTSFGQARIVEALRDVLETGFQSSLHAYPIVKDILSVEYVSSEGASTTKVSKDSTQSKRRTQDRHQDRRFRDAHSGAHDFWGEED